MAQPTDEPRSRGRQADSLPRSFEVTSLLASLAVSCVLAAGQETQEPATPFDPAQVVQRGCAILLDLQEGEGRREWPYEGVYRVLEPGSESPVIPLGYRVGGTAIACMAMTSAGGYQDERQGERRAAVARGVSFILEALDHPLMSPSRMEDYDVRGWGFVYALRLLIELEARGITPEVHAEAASKAIPSLIRALQDTALEEVGGWNYSGRGAPAPFMTAPALLALFAASARGYEVSDRIVDEALDSLERGRSKSGSIAYTTPEELRAGVDEDELGFMDKLPGAMGRMLAAESVLILGGRGDQERLSFAIQSFFENWEHLEARRKQTGTHVQPYGVAPYYVLYAHLQAAQAIELLAGPSERARWRTELRAILAQIQESDGSWNDRVFARSRNFGTAVGMLALLQPELGPPSRWVRRE